MSDKPMYDFNQTIPQCPTHNLSMDSDYLCILCRLELNGQAPAAFRKCSEGESGVVSGTDDMKFGTNRPKYRRGKAIESKDVYEPETNGMEEVMVDEDDEETSDD